MELYGGQLKNEKFNIRKVRSHRKNGTDKFYCDDIFTFDIETTNAWINENGNVIRYKAGQSAEYYTEKEPLALCYIWQFSYNDTVYYGRELTEFKKLLSDLPADAKIYIWVHNLAFETAFLFNILDGVEVFARAPHKPMYLKPKEFSNIEFRCTYVLTRLSLETWGESLGVNKLVGALDYEKIRTPLTPLTDLEMAYCEQDCKVVYAGIQNYLKRYGTQDKIPLTQTGTVRREVKNRLCIYPEYVKAVKKLCPSDANEYKMLQNVFAGGYTHANRIHAGEIITGLITHFDFSSFYPTVMIAEKYPYTPWAYIGHDLPDLASFEENAYIFHIRFYKIESITFNTYIQSFKCYAEHEKIDNGRTMAADILEMWITEQDFLTIRDTYKWEKMELLAVYQSTKDYLNTIFIEYILELYKNKTELKGVSNNDKPGAEELYMQSKQYINSMFGMMVTAIVQSDIILENDYKWTSKKLTAEEVTAKLQKLRNGWKRDKRYFLSYSWGCWVTAYARRKLWRCLLGQYDGKQWENDFNVLYADTDSLFMIGEHDFSWYNTEITKQLETALEHHGLNKKLLAPCDIKGKPHPLGIFEKEKNCVEFLTLGAKRYCERREDGKLYLTVSGINKKAVYCLKDDVENFKNGFEFDKDFPTVTKKLLTYCEDMPEVIYPDGYKSKYKYGINLRRTGYKLTMGEEYKDLLYYENLDTSALSDGWKNYKRGRFIL